MRSQWLATQSVFHDRNAPTPSCNLNPAPSFRMCLNGVRQEAGVHGCSLELGTQEVSSLDHCKRVKQVVTHVTQVAQV